MIRNVTISESKALDVFRSMILIHIMTQCAYMEYHNHILDVNLKSPVVHNKLKQIKENLMFVRDHVKSNFLKVEPGLEEEVEMETIIIQEIMQKIIKLDHVNLQQLLDNLTAAITDANTIKEATQ